MSEPNDTDFPCDGAHFYIPGPAGRIEATANCTNDNNQHLVIICHPHPQHGGTMQNKVVHTIDKAFSRTGALTVRFNFRGVSSSEGQYDHARGELDDLMAVMDWCLQHLPTYRISLAGFSFGAYIAMQAAQGSALLQLVTVAPPVDMFDFASLAKPDSPWLVIQGEADEIVDSHRVLQWAQQLAATDIVSLPATGHFFHGKLNALQQVIEEHARR